MYNFIHEFIENNEDIHDELKKEYEVLDEGSCSIIYDISDTKILKVFSLKNFLLSDEFYLHDGNHLCEFNHNKVKYLQEQLKINLKKSNNDPLAISSFVKSQVFDKSFDWLTFCFNFPSPNTPKIYSINFDVENCCYFVEMEKLNSNNEFLNKFNIENYKNFIEGLQYIFCNIKIASKNRPSLIKLLQESSKFCHFHILYENLMPVIFNIIKKIENNFKHFDEFEKYCDFSEQNVLFRDNEIVILDPIR
jgi:hypothetical protein